MPEFTLSLIQAANAERKANAWYLPSSNCEDWLREIAGWNVSHAHLKLIPLPASKADR